MAINANGFQFVLVVLPQHFPSLFLVPLPIANAMSTNRTPFPGAARKTLFRKARWRTATMEIGHRPGPIFLQPREERRVVGADG